MNVSHSKYMPFILEEVSKVRGSALPVHASLLQRALTGFLPCDKLHPNPDDEFCDPAIGPNDEIIRSYEEAYRHFWGGGGVTSSEYSAMARDALYVQKISTGGYMILNGHHRWIGAIQAGASHKLPVRLINLTQEADLRRMLDHAKHDKRVTMDLDEVIFTPAPDGKMEKSIAIPMVRPYRQKLRLGIPALIVFLEQEGYDVWLYSRGYYSYDYVEKLLSLYRVRVTGIITGLDRKGPKNSQTREKLQQLFNSRYAVTLHLDQNTLVRVDHANHSFHETPIPQDGTWAAQVMDLIRKANSVSDA